MKKKNKINTVDESVNVAEETANAKEDVTTAPSKDANTEEKAVDVDIDKIHVLIQPQSIIHSGVQFIDGAIVAQLGVPDMKLPIQYALFYPKRRPMKGNRIDFKALGSISFDEPDTDTFKGLEFAKMAGRKGGNMPTVFNAANEKAVALFLDNKIKFLDIYDIIWDCMENATFIENPDVDEILKTEQWCYDFIDKR